MKYLSNILLTFILTVFVLVGQPVRAETGTNPLITESFWKEIKGANNIPSLIQSEIKKGADINAIGYWGAPLHYAVTFDVPTGIPTLIESGANIYVTDNGGFILQRVAKLGDENTSEEEQTQIIRILDMIVTRDASLLHTVDQNGNTPLHSAFQFGTVKTINYLIDAGASQTIVNNNNQTPFQMIQNRGRPVWGSSFYSDHKDRFTDNLRLVWGKWENGKAILVEREN